jgi:formamidopyrimidine-DNA glycosylase
MPELPEVETVRRGLEKMLKDEPTIEHVELTRGDIRFPIPKNFASKLEGAKITGVRRRAKYLLIDTTKVTLLSHLGMTGSWRLEKDETPHDKHDHCFIDLSDRRTMVFRDPRRFGVLDLVKPGEESKHKLLKALGPEPFDEENFNAEKLFKRSRRRKIAVKVFIMDQKTVVGVGNIYASEALFRAGIKPQKQAGKLTKKEAEDLVRAIREVLNEAITAGGSSIRDYKNAGGESGAFQDAHQVYERGGEACRTCGTPIRTKVMGGRSTYWCPSCQR